MQSWRTILESRKICRASRAGSSKCYLFKSIASSITSIINNPAQSSRPALADASDLPLLHKRILVTAPRQYAHKLVSKLVEAGARPMWVPAITVSRLQQNSPQQCELRQSVLHLLEGSNTTHIAFTSRNGIAAFMETLTSILDAEHGSSSSSSSSSSTRSDKSGNSTEPIQDAVCSGLQERGEDHTSSSQVRQVGVARSASSAAVEWLKGSGLRLCALGADAELLASLGLAVHVVPDEASTQGLVRELVRRGEAVGARIMCPVPHVTGGLDEPSVVPRFLQALTDAGAHPLRVPAYETTLGCSRQSCTVEAQALDTGCIDAIAFSSTAEAQGLVHLFGLKAIHDAVQIHGTLLAAHGPYTAAGAALVLGLHVSVVSSSFSTFDGLVSALETASWQRSE